jgi:SAM-dependent methyltransferase
MLAEHDCGSEAPMTAADWDARYAAEGGGLFGEAPNEYLRMVAARSDFAARSALMLADGDGRNGTWLAGRGLSVAAVDLSPVATARAAARDAAAGVRVARETADLADWRPAGRFDAAFLLFLHGPPELRARAVRAAAAALAPGGWFVLEGFSVARDGAEPMGPDEPAKRWRLDALVELLPGFTLIEAFEGRTRLDEGPRHRGLAAVTRLAARAPG